MLDIIEKNFLYVEIWDFSIGEQEYRCDLFILSSFQIYSLSLFLSVSQNIFV